jgi:hypothetical protein
MVFEFTIIVFLAKSTFCHYFNVVMVLLILKKDAKLKQIEARENTSKLSLRKDNLSTDAKLDGRSNQSFDAL